MSSSCTYPPAVVPSLAARFDDRADQAADPIPAGWRAASVDGQSTAVGSVGCRAASENVIGLVNHWLWTHPA